MTEIQKIKEKQKELFFSGYFSRQGMENDEFPLTEGDFPGTYCFSDIDYSDNTRSRWDAARHCKRISLMLEKKENIENADFRKMMIGAVRYWVEHDYKNPNWWHNQIGMPKTMIDIALALEAYIPDDLKTGMEKLICRGSFKLRYILGKNKADDLDETAQSLTPDRWKGANLIWSAATTIKHALWTEDENLLKLAVERLADEIRYAKEGIQPDGAYCQHGVRWYSGGYGRSFVYEIAPIIYILHGTSFELPKEKTDMILSHIADGQRAMHKNGYFDFGAVGREYSRPGLIHADSLIPAVKLLSEVENIPRKSELESFYKELTDGDLYETTKFYNSICQLCHKKNGVYIGVRGRTEGILGAEKCNNEGVLSYNMSYGTVTCVMQSGKEYFDISPFWDYSKIPGTTAREESDEVLLSYEGWEEESESPCRAIGTAEGDCGILTEQAFHDGISVTASFFVFDGAMVVLGADINDKTPHKGKVYTTVEQCRAFSPVIKNNFVQNGGVFYKNLDLQTKFLSVSKKTQGSWSRNEYASSKEVLEDELLTITIPFEEYRSYAYLVYCKKEPNVRILRNDKDCQAIEIDGNRIMAVFHSDASFSADDKAICGKKGELLINVKNPEQSIGAI